MHTSQGLINLLQDLLRFNPGLRSSASTLLEHPYFADMPKDDNLRAPNTVHLAVDDLEDFDYYKQ